METDTLFIIEEKSDTSGNRPDTPWVRFDFLAKVFNMGGHSMPEDAKAFYQPIISRLKEYFETIPNQTVTFHFEFVYFNSSSSKMILEILELLPENSTVNWYCRNGDEDMFEAGEEFKPILDKELIFNIKMKWFLKALRNTEALFFIDWFLRYLQF